MKTNPAIYCAVLFSVLAHAQSYAPKDGFVPDPKTAVKTAEAVLIPVYGEKQIESERPFKAVLERTCGLLMALCAALTARAA